MTALHRLSLLQALLPGKFFVDGPERMRACAGALLGILATALVGRLYTGASAVTPWLIAPMGASSVLLFAVPSSPLAQPWSLIGGNLVAGIVGVACWLVFKDVALAAAFAAALAIGCMFVLRCLHPPSGAVALTAVLGGPAVHAMGFGFVWYPVMINSACLLAIAIIFNRATGRNYPHRPLPVVPARDAHMIPGFSAEDLDAVLRSHNEVLDISRDDLQSLFMQAQARAYERRFGALRCGDIMSRAVVSAEFATTLEEAWTLMQTHRIKALPVVDRARRVVGIVTQADFMRLADLSVYPGFNEKIRQMIRRTRSTHSDRPEVVGQIMSSPAQTVTADTHVAQLMPLLGAGAHSHVPIVDEERRLAGIVSPRDLIAALYRENLGRPA